MKKARIAAALLFGCSGEVPAVGSVADVTVYDRAENRTLPVHYHEGRYYLVGKPGNEYRIGVRKQDRLEEAKTSFAHFRQRYPDYSSPASLMDGVKP